MSHTNVATILRIANAATILWITNAATILWITTVADISTYESHECTNNVMNHECSKNRTNHDYSKSLQTLANALLISSVSCPGVARLQPWGSPDAAWEGSAACNCSSSPVLLFPYPFHLRVTAVARKRSRSFCQKCRRQVTAKHAYTLRMWLCMKWHGAWLHGVHRTCAATAAVSRGTSQASAVSTPLRWIFKKRAITS